MRLVSAAILLGLILACGPMRAMAAVSRSSAVVAERACTALRARTSATPGASPVLLRSYDAERGEGESLADPPLRTAAFTYDNALAVIALIACKRQEEAVRVGEALRLAATSEPRLRNAYRAGAVTGKPLPNGWWDAPTNRWAEDAAQDGTATGNVAWAALAMLALHEATGEPRWRDAAIGLARWAVANSADGRGAGGFSGGIEGYATASHQVLWKSTEHNIDLTALFAWLAQLQAAGGWAAHGDAARRFVVAQWDDPSGHFWIGSLPDGVTPNRDSSGLDVQLWAQLLPQAPASWRRAIDYAEREHRVRGGFDFDSDRDGLWLEGTAQAALVYTLNGRTADADGLFATIAEQFSSGGMIYATREPRITTGLAVGTGSVAERLYYYRRPHLGATAWAALAAVGWNPFVPGGRSAQRALKR